MDQGGTAGSTVEQVVEQQLRRLVERPAGEQLAVLTEVHRLLQDALATLDEV